MVAKYIQDNLIFKSALSAYTPSNSKGKKEKNILMDIYSCAYAEWNWI